MTKKICFLLISAVFAFALSGCISHSKTSTYILCPDESAAKQYNALVRVNAIELPEYLDRSMIIGYGHDDRSCAYAELRAIIDLKAPETTAVCIGDYTANELKKYPACRMVTAKTFTAEGIVQAIAEDLDAQK